MLIVRVMYGTKSSGADFRALLADNIHNLGYRPLIVDPGVWIRPEAKPGGFVYYEYVTCFT